MDTPECLIWQGTGGSEASCAAEFSKELEPCDRPCVPLLPRWRLNIPLGRKFPLMTDCDHQRHLHQRALAQIQNNSSPCTKGALVSIFQELLSENPSGAVQGEAV